MFLYARNKHLKGLYTAKNALEDVHSKSKWTYSSFTLHMAQGALRQRASLMNEAVSYKISLPLYLD
jgi:hypothetical protein